VRRRRSPLGRPRPLPAHVLRHSRMVFVMRLMLPIVAAVLLGALVLWSKLGLDTDRFSLALAAIGPQQIDSLAMTNPHFQGVDEKKRPFNVTAKMAMQLDKKGDLIALTAPEADITLESGNWLTVNSESGRYERAKQILELNGDVSIFHDQGYEMHTRDVRIDLAANRATGHQPVAGQGPAGDLAAQGIDIADGGKRVFLLGRSHVVLFASDQKQLGLGIPTP